MTSHKTLISVALTLWLTTGCTVTRMQSPRQLKHGELIASGSISEPGDLLVPRLDAQVAVGLADFADLSAHIGSSVLAQSAGVGLRMYPTTWLTLSSQLEGRYVFAESYDDVETASTAELHAVFRPTFLFYDRKQGGFYVGPQVVMSWLDRKDSSMIAFGAFSGYEIMFTKAQAIQFEVSLLPFWTPLTNISPDDDIDNSLWFLTRGVQVSFGYTVFLSDFMALADEPKSKPQRAPASKGSTFVRTH